MDLITRKDAMRVLEAVKFATDAEREYAFSLMEQLPAGGQVFSYSEGFADGYKLGREDALAELKKDQVQKAVFTRDGLIFEYAPGALLQETGGETDG